MFGDVSRALPIRVPCRGHMPLSDVMLGLVDVLFRHGHGKPPSLAHERGVMLAEK